MSKDNVIHGNFGNKTEREIIVKLLDVIMDLAIVSEKLLLAVDPNKMTASNYQEIRAKLDQVLATGHEVNASLPRI